jgi:hypothetical protein
LKLRVAVDKDAMMPSFRKLSSAEVDALDHHPVGIRAEIAQTYDAYLVDFVVGNHGRSGWLKTPEQAAPLAESPAWMFAALAVNVRKSAKPVFEAAARACAHFAPLRELCLPWPQTERGLVTSLSPLRRLRCHSSP